LGSRNPSGAKALLGEPILFLFQSITEGSSFSLSIPMLAQMLFKFNDALHKKQEEEKEKFN
jgi:hypothetical protein